MRQDQSVEPGVAFLLSRTVGAWPPLWFWILPAAVGLLRTAPFLWLQCVDPPEGQAFMGVGYIPKDFLAYVSFIRQVGDDGSLLFVNPFTTDPQMPRFILLFHYTLGLVAAVTGFAPHWVLELSRLPLTFLFFGILWWFLAPLLPGAHERLWACILVGLSGGFEALLRPFAASLPAGFAVPFNAATWAMYGWNSFAAFYNPLWIAALTLGLIVLRPAMTPQGPQGMKDALVMGFAFFLLYWTHPYTAVLILGVICLGPVVQLILTGNVDWRRAVFCAATLGFVLVVILLIARWQSEDAVFRNSSGGVFGSQDVSVFWYPLTLGLVGVLAVQGAVSWARDVHPSRHAMAAWLTAAVFLHSSPVLNGYKYVLYLHLPLCVLAAPALSRLIRNRHLGGVPGKLKATGAVALCCASFVFVTFESLGEVERINYVPAETPRVIEALSQRPRGNVLAPPWLGNVIPAFTHHHVWVGQWFLTPDFLRRVEAYEILTSNPEHADRLKMLLQEQSISYLILWEESARALMSSLSDRVVEHIELGRLRLLVMQPGISISKESEE